jgi:hypothetical protein
MMEKKTNLLNVPIPLLKLVGYIFRKSNDVDRLINSLEVDISHTCQILNWRPPFNIDRELKKMTDNFIEKSFK